MLQKNSEATHNYNIVKNMDLRLHLTLHIKTGNTSYSYNESQVTMYTVHAGIDPPGSVVKSAAGHDRNISQLLFWLFSMY